MEWTDVGGVRDVGSADGDTAGDEPDDAEEGADDSLLLALFLFLLSLLSSSSLRLRFSPSLAPCEDGSGWD